MRGEELTASFDEVAARPLVPMARLRALMEAVLRHLEEHKQMFLFLVELGPIAELGLQRLAGPAAERVHRRCHKHLEQAVAEAQKAGVLREDLPATELVNFLSGIIHGQLRAWLMSGAKRRLSTRASSLMDLFANGAVARP
jgi:hypothetical protein